MVARSLRDTDACISACDRAEDVAALAGFAESLQAAGEHAETGLAVRYPRSPRLIIGNGEIRSRSALLLASCLVADRLREDVLKVLPVGFGYLSCCSVRRLLVTTPFGSDFRRCP